MRGIILAVAGTALFLGIFVAGLRWLRYPRVKVTVFNESSTGLVDVRIKFLYGERTAERIDPGGFAVTEIQSGGDACVYLSYRAPEGASAEDELLYCSDEHGSPDRGFLEVHVAREGTRLVNGIYTAVDIPAWTVRVAPAGRMTVSSFRHW